MIYIFVIHTAACLTCVPSPVQKYFQRNITSVDIKSISGLNNTTSGFRYHVGAASPQLPRCGLPWPRSVSSRRSRRRSRWRPRRPSSVPGAPGLAVSPLPDARLPLSPLPALCLRAPLLPLPLLLLEVAITPQLPLAPLTDPATSQVKEIYKGEIKDN